MFSGLQSIFSLRVFFFKSEELKFEKPTKLGFFILEFSKIHIDEKFSSQQQLYFGSKEQ